MFFLELGVNWEASTGSGGALERLRAHGRRKLMAVHCTAGAGPAQMGSETPAFLQPAKTKQNHFSFLTLGLTTKAAGEQPAHTAAPRAAQPGALCLPVLPGGATAPHICRLCLPHAQGPWPWDHRPDEYKAHSQCSQLPSGEKPHAEAHGAVAVVWHLAVSGMTEPSSHLLTIMDLSSSTSCSSSANSLKDSAVRK